MKASLLFLNIITPISLTFIGLLSRSQYNLWFATIILNEKGKLAMVLLGFSYTVVFLAVGRVYYRYKLDCCTQQRNKLVTEYTETFLHMIRGKITKIEGNIFPKNLDIRIGVAENNLISYINHVKNKLYGRQSSKRFIVRSYSFLCKDANTRFSYNISPGSFNMMFEAIEQTKIVWEDDLRNSSKDYDIDHRIKSGFGFCMCVPIKDYKTNQVTSVIQIDSKDSASISLKGHELWQKEIYDFCYFINRNLPKLFK